MGAGGGIGTFFLFTTGSRGGTIGLGALAGVGFWLLKISRRQRVILILVGGLLGALFAVSNPRVRAMFEPTEPGAAPNISNVQRRAMLEAGWLRTLDRPLFGWGLHTTPLVYPRYRAELNGGTETVLQLHSAPVEIGSGLGIFGLTVIGLLSLLAIRDVRNSPAAGCTVIGYGMFALTDYQLDLPVVTMVIAVSGALLASARRTTGSAVQERTIYWIPLSCLTLAGGIALFGHRPSYPGINVEALELARDPSHADRAIDLLRSSLELDPFQEIAHFNLGWLLVVRDPAQAAFPFEQAAQLVPDKGGVYFGLGLASLNQTQTPSAAGLLALECLNDPRFLHSPWWTVDAIAALIPAVQQDFLLMIEFSKSELPEDEIWRQRMLQNLAASVAQLGLVPPGEETTYRRERTGYPVLMRDLDLPPPVDLYDVRERPRDSARTGPELPDKGWLPAPLLLKLLDLNLNRIQ
ncbi:MAG: O-antigen ligase family protein [Candidatus Synoicihabitans palmerolidicus]|nr:O-antigen ligase family protein [Candidatus Synoicihabitans palmerolidicus]